VAPVDTSDFHLHADVQQRKMKHFNKISDKNDKS
jgi:hypothetical protein